MRRKGKKSQVVNEVKTETLIKSTRQSSRRRKRSSSVSSEDEVQKEDTTKNQINVDTDLDPVEPDSGNNLIMISENKKNTQEDTTEKNITGEREENTIPVEINERIDEIKKRKGKIDEGNEEIAKGKSTGIDNSNNDLSSNHIEPENENVQGSTPPPKHADENLQNTNKIPNTNEQKQEDVQDNIVSKDTITQQSPIEEQSFESQYANEETQDKIQDSVNGHVSKDQERSTTPELKYEKVNDKPEEKKLTLKRSGAEQYRRPSSPLEDGEIQEPKEKSRKITLKRRTAEHNSDFDKIVINRRPSVTDEKKENRKRLSSVTEENTLIVVGKPNKPSKTVKLVRNFSQDSSQDSEACQRVQKNIWGKSQFLDNISANTHKVDVDSIKVICPSLEFLNESEVKLEEVPKQPVINEYDADKKIEQDNEEEEEKSEEESEKEQSEEEESSEEQKIEANPNIIALNRKISIVEDTASKMRPPPSPAKSPPTEIIFITNLVRPFTVKQLKDLLERTGKIKDDGFWTDKIKSKCYAHFENVEQAESTRNALHGVHWPIGNGKQLVIDFGTEEDMEAARNPMPLPIQIPEKLPDKENMEPDVIENRRRERERDVSKEERRRDVSAREWDKSREDHRRRHSRSKSRERVRKHSRRSHTPEEHTRKKHKDVDESVPQKLMDDLFLKTKAMPSIYWQPLSPQEIATKQQQRLIHMKEYKRRIQETSRGHNRGRDRRNFRRR